MKRDDEWSGGEASSVDNIVIMCWHRVLLSVAVTLFIAFDLVVTLTFDLWPWKISAVPADVNICGKFCWNQSAAWRDRSTWNRSLRTDGQPEITMPPSPLFGGSRHRKLSNVFWNKRASFKSDVSWFHAISQLPNLFIGTPRIYNFILLLIKWVRSFSTMLPSVKFAEDKVLVFVILREINDHSAL